MWKKNKGHSLQTVNVMLLVARYYCLLLMVCTINEGQQALADENRESLNADHALQIVITKRAENQRRIPDCQLVWHYKTVNDGFMVIRGHEGALITEGDNKLFKKNEKMATESLGQKFVTNVGIETSGVRTAYNGVDFRIVPNVDTPKDIAILPAPEYRMNNNWFEIIGWHRRDNAPQFLRRMQTAKPDNINIHECSISSSESGSERVCKIRISDSGNGTFSILAYNMDQGGCRISEQWFNSKQILYFEHTQENKEVSPDFWLPVVLKSRSYGDDKKIILDKTYFLDLSNSAFGEDVTFSDSVFEMPISPEMEVSDYRAGIKLIYEGESVPLSMDNLKKRIADVANGISPQKLTGNGRAIYLFLVLNGALLTILAIALYYRRKKKRKLLANNAATPPQAETTDDVE